MKTCLMLSTKQKKEAAQETKYEKIHNFFVTVGLGK